MVEKLGIEGMSSDESDPGEGRIVHAKPWISREVQDLLEFIDANKKTTNELGNLLPGAPAVSRTRRRTQPPLSARRALEGLPKNFYDPVFVLNEGDKAKHLHATDPMELPIIDD